MKPLNVEMYKVDCLFRTVTQEYFQTVTYRHDRVKLNSLVVNKLRSNNAL